MVFPFGQATGAAGKRTMNMTVFEIRRHTLRRIYALYEEFLTGHSIACVKGCAHCCTGRVTLTTLEAYELISNWESAQRAAYGHTVKDLQNRPRFQPRFTTNQIAGLCAQGRQCPEEPPPADDGGVCAFLSAGQCPFYPARPFACRCMVSQSVCRTGGSALVDPLILSANTVFMQFIEHIDLIGASGNLIDVLAALATDADRSAYTHGALTWENTPLIANQPLKTLMIPPEHRNALMPLVQQIQQIRV